MSQQAWWYLSRSTGIVATVVAVAALVWGFFFSARNTGSRRRPAWWLDLHNWLGGLALVFTAAHLLTVYVHHAAAIGLLQVLVPWTAAFGRWAIAWGVIATYLLTIVVFTSWPSKRLRPGLWRAVHLSSVAGVALAGVHAFQIGSDAGEWLFRAGLVALAAFFVYATAVRLLGVLTGRQAPTEVDSQQIPT